MLIAICGVDGSGKNVYSQRLKEKFINREVCCINPMKEGQLINSLINFASQNKFDIYDMFSSTFISSCYAFDLLVNTNKVYSPDADKIIISHRFDICCKVYAKMRKADSSQIEQICAFLPAPDLTIYLSIDADLALSRIEQRGSNKSWKENLNHIEQALELYEFYLQFVPNKHLLRLDNNIPLDEIESNLNLIYKKIEEIVCS